MAKPNLTAVSFPKLHMGQGQVSTGTVTGTHIAVGFPVHIVNKSGNKTWDGQVDSSAGSGKWNASVKRTSLGDDKKEALETVAVTVTNNSTGEMSNTVETESDVVP